MLTRKIIIFAKTVRLDIFFEKERTLDQIEIELFNQGKFFS